MWHLGQPDVLLIEVSSFQGVLIRGFHCTLLGHGKLLLADGGYYEGTFVRGEMEGHGYRYIVHGRWHV